MKLLILGGTLFVGRHLVHAAGSRGHEVTLFNRGRTNPGLFPDLETLHGDRDGDLEALQGREWDAVIDTCGYVPRVVRTSAELLAGRIGHYTFISSGSVYSDYSRPGIDERAPVRTLPDESVEDVANHYGALKALCERTLEEILAGRILIVRAGLLAGPHDPTDRFTYWPRRIARGGEVLAPGRPGRQVQLIDARDVAEWVVRMVESSAAGVYNVTGPPYVLTMAQLLETCRSITGSDARFIWVGESFLIERGVAPFSDLPLWLPEEYNGMLAMDIGKALEVGLSFRSLADTITDTLTWDRARPRETGATPRSLPSGADTTAGLDSEREALLLEEWRAMRTV